MENNHVLFNYMTVMAAEQGNVLHYLCSSIKTSKYKFSLTSHSFNTSKLSPDRISLLKPVYKRIIRGSAWQQIILRSKNKKKFLSNGRKIRIFMRREFDMVAFNKLVFLDDITKQVF